MIETLLDQFQQNTWLELGAVVFGVAYLLLAVRENILCWYAAFISTVLFLFVFWQVRLYMESGLQIYYLAMAIYGWVQWRAIDNEKQTLKVSTWRVWQHVVALSLIVFASLGSAFLLSKYSNAALPLVDSFTTWGSIVTTFMVTRKILENWIYWLVIDGVSIFLYIDRGLYFTALLFAVYIIIIFFGWFAWMKSYRNQPA